MKLGEFGESFARNLFLKKGYKLISQNWRCKSGEIDLIMESPEGLIIFLEVKSMHDLGPNSLTPEDQLSFSKISKMRRAAEMFVAKHPSLFLSDREWRIDAITLQFEQGFEVPEEQGVSLTDYSKNCLINYYENL